MSIKLEDHLYPRGKSALEPDLLPNVLDSDGNIVSFNSPKRITSESTVVNLGDAPNTNNGDPLRIAFAKINNFIEASYWNNDSIVQKFTTYDSELKDGIFVYSDSDVRYAISLTDDTRLKFNGTPNNIRVTANSPLTGAGYNDIVTMKFELADHVKIDQLTVKEHAHFDSDVFIKGSLYIGGSSTTINTQNVTVSDPVMVLNSGQPTPINDTGLIFQRYDSDTVSSVFWNSYFVWDESAVRFVLGETSGSGRDNNPPITMRYTEFESGKTYAYDASNTLRSTISYGLTNTNTVVGNYVIDATGDITLDFDGNDLYFKNGAGNDTATWNFADNANLKFTTPGELRFDPLTNLVIDGYTIINSNARVNGDTTITGHTRINQGLIVDSDTSIGGNTTVSGNTTIEKNLDVLRDIDGSGKLHISESAAIDSDLVVGGSVTISGSQNIAGNSNIIGDLYVDGHTHITDSLLVDSDVRIRGTLTVDSELIVMKELTVHKEALFYQDVDFDKSILVRGDFTVNGTTTFVTSENLSVFDPFIVLNKGQASPFNDTGFIFTRYDSDTVSQTAYNAIFEWDETDDVFVMGSTSSSGLDQNPTIVDKYMSSGVTKTTIHKKLIVDSDTTLKANLALPNVANVEHYIRALDSDLRILRIRADSDETFLQGLRLNVTGDSETYSSMALSKRLNIKGYDQSIRTNTWTSDGDIIVRILAVTIDGGTF